MTWDSAPRPHRHGSVEPGKITIEFDRTKYHRVANFRRGLLTFKSRDINAARQDVIWEYPGLDKIYVQQRQISAETDGSFEILGHGSVTDKTSTENCSREGLTCSGGSNTACERGKCVRGYVKQEGKKWKFFSGSESYYVFPENGMIKLRHTRGGKSRYSVIYVPPNTYLDMPFSSRAVEAYDGGVDDSKDAFCREYMQRGGDIEQQVRGDLSMLTGPWPELIDAAITESSGEYLPENRILFLRAVYDQLSALFSKAIQETPSSFKPSALIEYGQNMARPIYSRLPGEAGSYYSEEGGTVAQWLTSGGDEELSTARDRIAGFYYDYLDPDTCRADSLDWLCQHVGLFGELWDFGWDEKIKRTMIKNAFGWYDSAYDGTNHKSKILNEFPFTQPLWSNEDTSKEYNYAEIGKVVIQNGEIVKSDRFVLNSINTQTNRLTLQTSSIVHFNKSEWNGLIESKGSMLCFAFLVSLFNLKIHDSRELELVDGALRVRSGLRECESDAAPLMPFQLNLPEVGSTTDLVSRNLTNQLVCGVTRVCSYEASRNVILRVPFYYNRGGRSWNKAEYIAKSWMPNNINCRVQYGYLACGTWAVGDAFFEPQVVNA